MVGIAIFFLTWMIASGWVLFRWRANRREIERMKAVTGEQMRRAKAGAVPICHHGIPMDEVCPQCAAWMREHISRLPQNPRRG